MRVIRIVSAVLLIALVTVGCEESVLSEGLLVEEAQTVRYKNPAGPEPGKPIRICSYNIQNFTDGVDDGYHRTPTVLGRQSKNAAAILDRINADIVVIQEIENDVILNKLNDLLAKPYPVAAITRLDAKGRTAKLNIGLLSRLPAENLTELDFSNLKGTYSPPRGVLRFEVDLGGGHRLLVYGVHFKSNHGEDKINRKKRMAAAAIIREDAELVMAGNPEIKWEVIVSGDMNTDPDAPRFKSDPSLKPFEGWRDVWEGASLEERASLPFREGDPDLAFPPICFDRFVVSPALDEKPWAVTEPHVHREGIDVGNIYVQPGQNDLHVSDHYPVVIDLAP